MPKRPAKKMHPAEIATEAAMIDAIRGATGFLASIFVGAGQYEKVPGTTLLEAQRKGNAFVALHRVNSRPIMYAIGADGRATMITNALIDRMTALHARTK